MYTDRCCYIYVYVCIYVYYLYIYDNSMMLYIGVYYRGRHSSGTRPANSIFRRSENPFFTISLAEIEKSFERFGEIARTIDRQGFPSTLDTGSDKGSATGCAEPASSGFRQPAGRKSICLQN